MSLTIERTGHVTRFRILMFAVGGSGRARADERRIEITSTYAGGLARDSDAVDVVLGVEREQGLLVGIDSKRLGFGGTTSNASTFVYTAGFDALSTRKYEILVNPSKLIANEHQIYMHPSFLIEYLLNIEPLHRLGVTAWPDGKAPPQVKQTVSPDDPIQPHASVRLTYEQQTRLAILKMEVGQAGERRVASEERRRLARHGHTDLARRVEWISQTRPYVGYDISSFGQNRAPEVIEVKSSSGALKRFHFSNNELRVAEKKRSAYRLICVSNVFGTPVYREIRDPASELEIGNLIKIPDGYIVSI